MSKAIEWFKIKIKGLELTWSDLFLAIGFITFVPFAALSWLFMVTWDPTDIPFTPLMMITCFSISAICWGIYFYLEIRKGTIKNNLFLWVYILFVILSIVSILIQPSLFEIDVPVRDVTPATWEYYGEGIKIGDIVHVSLPIPWIHKMFFCFGSILITTVFYFLFIVFPQRVKSLNILIFFGVFIFAFMLVLTIYSYVVERENYSHYIYEVFRGNVLGAQGVYAMKSFMTHRVPYGACLMLGTIYALVLHGYNKKWYWIIPILYCYLNMLFTYCKTSLFLTTLTLFIYLIFRLVVTFKNHKLRNSIVLSILGFLVLTALTVLITSLVTNGEKFPLILIIYKSFVFKHSLDARVLIWKNIQIELSGGWWIIGRGFGTHNFMLYPMNLVNGDKVCPSHSTYYAVLGAGGIFNLIGFLALYIYFGYAFWKCFKVNKELTIGLSIGFFAFFLYSFTEGVNYLIAFFAAPIIFYYNILKKKGIYNN